MVQAEHKSYYNVQMYDDSRGRWITNGQKHKDYEFAKGCAETYTKLLKRTTRVIKTSENKQVETVGMDVEYRQLCQ